MPRVGIAIPSYLASSFIGETLRSVVDQTFEDWCCVVVNDGPEDGTAAVVQAFGDPRIRYVCDGRSRGQFANFNRAILEVLKENPEIIRLLCADDLLYSHGLADTIRLFDQHERVGLVASHFDLIDAKGMLVIQADMSAYPDKVMPGRDYLLVGVAVGNAIGGPSSVAIRREAIETAGIFTTRVNHSGEADLWHRIAEDWDIGWVGGRTGLQYRLHDASVTGRGKYSVAKFTDPIRLVRHVAASEPLFGIRWWVHQYTIGRLHSINLQLIAAMAWHGRWDGVKAGLRGCVAEGFPFYAPFWLPRIPWQVVRHLVSRSASRRLLWRRAHDALQPPTIPVAPRAAKAPEARAILDLNA
jgi:glycosyltransferase involved in cell wall biosynthesis